MTMRTRLQIALAVVLLTLAGLMVWQVIQASRKREPVYQGKPFSRWPHGVGLTIAASLWKQLVLVFCDDLPVQPAGADELSTQCIRSSLPCLTYESGAMILTAPKASASTSVEDSREARKGAGRPPSFFFIQSFCFPGSSAFRRELQPMCKSAFSGELDWLPAASPVSVLHVHNPFAVPHCRGCSVEPAHAVRGEHAAGSRLRPIAGAGQRANIIHLRSRTGGTRFCAQSPLAACRIRPQRIPH
jgi:hypothetical protein